MNFWTLVVTVFLASSVEAVEMVTIVVGVGAIRRWRDTLIGAVSGFVVLLVIAGGLGTALKAIPIATLRLVIGALLLIFGLQWLTKSIRKVAAQGFEGEAEEVEVEGRSGQG